MKKAMFTITIGLLLFAPFACDIQIARAALAQDVKKQADAFAGAEGAGIQTKKDPRTIAAEIIKIFLSLIGTLILIYVVYSGYLIMTAGGESEKIDKAKHILKNCVIGTILVLSSYGIVVMVGKFVGVDTSKKTLTQWQSENGHEVGGVEFEQEQYTGCDAEIQNYNTSTGKWEMVPNPALNDPLNPMCATGPVDTGGPF